MYNLFFIIKWTYTLFDVLLRTHFKKVQFLFTTFTNVEGKFLIDDYETGLAKYKRNHNLPTTSESPDEREE